MNEWIIKLKVNQSWHIWVKGWIEFWVNLTQSPRLNCHLPWDSACFLFACLNRIDFIPPNRRGWSGSFVGRRAIVIQCGWYNHVLSLSQTQAAICVIIVTIGLGDLLMFFVRFFFFVPTQPSFSSLCWSSTVLFSRDLVRLVTSTLKC